MDWKKLLIDYFSFTRKDRIGILVIIILMTLIFFLPGILKRVNTIPAPLADSSWIVAAKKLEKKDTMEYRQNWNDNPAYDPPFHGSSPVSLALFFFDPNSITKDEWLKLGLKEKTIQTIQNYLNKGGVFRKPEDLQRVYGLRKADYERLVPFVRIKNNTTQHSSDLRQAGKEYAGKTTSSPVKAISSIDINSADTSAFIILPGIGSKLAARIINFRTRLGGFYSTSQVSETFGLTDSVFQKIRPYLQLKSQQVKKININSAALDELKNHPYLRFAVANAIIAFRNQHGPFRQIEDLKNVVAVTPEIYEKINPYLEL